MQFWAISICFSTNAEKTIIDKADSEGEPSKDGFCQVQQLTKKDSSSELLTSNEVRYFIIWYIEENFLDI